LKQHCQFHHLHSLVAAGVLGVSRITVFTCENSTYCGAWNCHY
jgi:hypothetical protein